MSNELAAVMELLYAIEDEFSTDDNRYYVTGLSMGGFGTWDLLMRYPEVFAAGVPICGGADPSYAEVLKDVPIYTVHSTDDPTVPVMGTQAMVKALKEAGSLLIFYEELEGFGHGVWNWTAEQADIWEWLFTQNLSFR
jgi:predicted peptidase